MGKERGTTWYLLLKYLLDLLNLLNLQDMSAVVLPQKNHYVLRNYSQSESGVRQSAECVTRQRDQPGYL
jgi:hypothetical protein